MLAKTGMRLGELVHLLIEDLDLDKGWLIVRNKPELGWRIKTGRERAIPLIDEVVAVLRKVIGSRTAGLVFLREKFSASRCPLADLGRKRLAAAVQRRVAEQEVTGGTALSRSELAKIVQTIWRDAGATKSDRVRQSFMRIAAAVGFEDATCPKSWRHSFATLLQDANVDPLIRQITLGHAPVGSSEGALGMTSIYTHTRPETQRREIIRAMALWPQSLGLERLFASGESLR
jgi:integrase